MSQQREAVIIQDGTFDPIRLSIPVETAVVWRNEDTADHRIVSVQFHETATDWHFRSQSLRPDDSVVYSFDTEGVYEYFCRIHGKSMCGAILVGDASLTQSLPCEEEEA